MGGSLFPLPYGTQEGNGVATEVRRFQGPWGPPVAQRGTAGSGLCVRAWVCAHVCSGRVCGDRACVCGARACAPRVFGRGGGGRATRPR